MRKKIRESFKEQYGYATVDGEVVEIGNYTVEPSCYSDDTEVLTSIGWKLWNLITKQDLLGTYNVKTKSLEFQYPERIMREHYKGKMYFQEARDIDLLVTPNHNLWITTPYKNRFNLVEARNSPQEVLYQNGIENWIGYDTDVFSLPKITTHRRLRNGKMLTTIVKEQSIPIKHWISFLGWWLGRGYLWHQGGDWRIYIIQSDESLRKEIKDLIKKLGFGVYESKNKLLIRNKQLFEYLKQFGKSEDRFIPLDILQLRREYLLILFNCLMRSEGSPNYKIFHTNSKELADNFQELCLKLGLSSTLSTRGNGYNVYYSTRIFSEVNASSVNRELVDYDGMVHCASVPNRILVVRRNGKISLSGNSIFMGRGEHPRRGSWKEGPSEEDIILNLSPGAFTPKDAWKREWCPNKLYVARWKDKLTGKIKYVRFSPTAPIQQKKEIEKFDKANDLDKHMKELRKHISDGLFSKDMHRAKIATVCALIDVVNLRVGDEKNEDEADTVGAITLRPEHVTIEDDHEVVLNFLGKDSIEWNVSFHIGPQVVHNLLVFKNCDNYLFEGICSKDVSKFLQEIVPNLTTKVFRTYKTTKIVQDTLKEYNATEYDTLYTKRYYAKMANLEGAKVCNHKKKISPKFKERLIKKQDQFNKYVDQLNALYAKDNKTKRDRRRIKSLIKRIDKKKLEIDLYESTKEYNLNTSLKNYIDPRIFSSWCKDINCSLDKVYPKSLLKKFSWAYTEEEGED